MNKRKILNDPVYGFITIPSELIFDLVEHPYFQRLRRIRQLGMTDLVYPGALHTRFHHALGAMHLMGEALKTLQEKGHSISDKECEAAQVAILLHDIGHGPFSHVLEHTLLSSIHHEELSLLIMKELNRQFSGRLSSAIQMFEGSYPRRFFHQLISSQLDMDRMDYLNRDCFYTGVAEGTIGAGRLIKMLDIDQEELVVEEKGLLSIENFLNARRLMYWQVYLHKTSLCAEAMLMQAIRRARELCQQNSPLFASPALLFFLSHEVSLNDFDDNPELLNRFTNLDDYDIWTSLKSWATHPDPVLSTLCDGILNRKLFKIQFFDGPPTEEFLAPLRDKLRQKGIQEQHLSYFLVAGQTTNSAYESGEDQIKVKMKSGAIVDIVEASELPTIRALSKIVRKYYVCWGKTVSLRG
ncbi:HD domain-containing protein [Arundinibacter roseus]|uniref:HD domain-containing protein n=1 Tax=Arundinibacter roseus TaxID=2070510 RepID=A0A4R4K2B4_9BACT|nr:HD domain-containing protein [Arundinibacter roseus]TDB61418.1 HD domain-containing protein [Arundinibacter roseus]